LYLNNVTNLHQLTSQPLTLTLTLTEQGRGMSEGEIVQGIVKQARKASAPLEMHAPCMQEALPCMQPA